MSDNPRLLIDADSLIYRTGFSTQYTLHTLRRNNEELITKYKKDIVEAQGKGYELVESVEVVEPIENAIHLLKNSLFEMYDRFPIFSPEIILSDPSHNWRYDIAQDYKANRVQEKPVHHAEIFKYLIEHHNAYFVPQYEADDVLAHRAQECDTYIIAGIDKDLLQIPGDHYNYIHKKLVTVGFKDAISNFYTQILTGDSSDNIKGLYRVGPAKAKKLLEGAEDEEEMWWRVLCAYESMSNVTYDEIVTRAQLLYLGMEQWEAPHE